MFDLDPTGQAADAADHLRREMGAGADDGDAQAERETTALAAAEKESTRREDERRLERLVTHCELKLTRARAFTGHRARGRIAYRERKLDEAQKALARIQGRAGEAP